MVGAVGLRASPRRSTPWTGGCVEVRIDITDGRGEHVRSFSSDSSEAAKHSSGLTKVDHVVVDLVRNEHAALPVDLLLVDSLLTAALDSLAGAGLDTSRSDLDFDSAAEKVIYSGDKATFAMIFK